MFHFWALKICVTTADVRHSSARDLNISTPSKVSMDKSKKRKGSEENRTLNATWADSFFIHKINVKNDTLL